MAQPQTVKVVEVVRVAPAPDYSAGSVTSTESLPLTFFDLLWLRFPPVERLFFYQVSNAPNTSLHESILPKLKHSLSLTLRHFLPLCGNLIWPQDTPKPVVNHVHGDGVSLIIAESTMDFYRLSSNDHFRDVLECRPLVPNLVASHEKAPVLALQVTLFPNSGFCIGITTHHAVVDGKSSTSFLKSWAQICKTESASLGPELTPLYDRTVIKDPTGLDSLFANAWLKNDGPSNRSLKPSLWPIPAGAVRATFELSREDIEKLRASICAAETEQSNRRRISTFAIICGYAWVCREKARQARDETAALVFSVDCRSRLKPSIHPKYFGNCITGCSVAAETEELLGENGLTAAVKAINEAIRKLDDGVLNGAERWISLTTSHAPARCTGFGSSPRFEVYNIDFGWGRPRKVDLTSIDRTEAISIDQSSNGNGGVELGMVLNPQEMERFAASFAKGLQAL